MTLAAIFFKRHRPLIPRVFPNLNRFGGWWFGFRGEAKGSGIYRVLILHVVADFVWFATIFLLKSSPIHSVAPPFRVEPAGRASIRLRNETIRNETTYTM